MAGWTWWVLLGCLVRFVESWKFGGVKVVVHRPFSALPLDFGR